MKARMRLSTPEKTTASRRSLDTIVRTMNSRVSTKEIIKSRSNEPRINYFTPPLSSSLSQTLGSTGTPNLWDALAAACVLTGEVMNRNSATMTALDDSKNLRLTSLRAATE